MPSKDTDAETAKGHSVHTRYLTDGDADADPQMLLVRAVADFKGMRETELATLYPCIDHFVEHLYSNPPSPSAQSELSFEYEGFRITLYQDGTAVFQEHT